MTSTCYNIMRLVNEIALVYTVTLIVCTSTLFDPIRQWVILRTPSLYSPLSFIVSDYEYPANLKHFISCRMCVGFWVSLFVCISVSDYYNFFIVFASSYFIATQER